MRRTGAVGRTAALALCVVAMLRHMHVVTAVGTQLGSVQFPMLDPLRDDERQPPPDLSPFLAKEPGANLLPPPPTSHLVSHAAAASSCRFWMILSPHPVPRDLRCGG